MLLQETNENKPFVLALLFWKVVSLMHGLSGFLISRRYWGNRIKNLDKAYLSFVNEGEKVLTKDQHEIIDELFSKYQKIRHFSHSFYTDKTCAFDKRYIPDSLHRFTIDRYFNNWSAAKYIDNKCYYPLMFQDVNIPKTVAYRLNGFWYQKWGGN